MNRACRHLQHGFTVVETAVMLAVALIVIGIIYFAAAMMFEQARIETAYNTVLTVRDRVRNYALNLATLGAPAGTDVTATMLSNGVFPDFMSDATLATHEWHGRVTSPPSANGNYQIIGLADRFSVRLNNIPSVACSELAARLTGNFSFDGALTVEVGDTGVTLTPRVRTLPVNADTLVGDCSQPLGASIDENTYYLAVTYALRDPNL